MDPNASDDLQPFHCHRIVPDLSQYREKDVAGCNGIPLKSTVIKASPVALERLS